MEENNMLIAKFMGNPTIFNEVDDATLFNIKEQWNLVYALDELRYDSSWNWLMPVLEKIEGICFEDVEDNIFDAEDCYSIKDTIPNIHSTYAAIVEFIKSYNEWKQVK